MSLLEKVTLKQRERITELETRVTQQAAFLVQRAVNDLADDTNTLAYLTEQAEIGNPGAREVLRKYFEMQRRAQVAASGILLPSGAAHEIKAAVDGQPN